MARRLLQGVAVAARRRYLVVFGAAAALVGVSLVLAARLRFDADVFNLLPQDNPVVAELKAALEQFGSADFLLVAVRIPEGEVTAPYEAFADELGRRLAELDLLRRVDYRIGEPEELLAAFFPKAVLFLDAAGREELAARATDPALRDRARELRHLLTTPQALAWKDLVRLDPLGVSEIFLEHVASGREGMALDWTSGYLLSRDQRMLLLLAKPMRPPQDIEFDRRLVAAVERQVELARGGWDELVGAGGPPPPEVALGGTYVVALEDASLIRRDAVINAGTSMAGVLLLFLFAFRRWGPLAYAFVPLACGLILTFGFSAATYGVLSSATSGIAALLIGLGIDFVIVSYGRFVEERQRGSSLEQALAVMSGSSGRAVVVGAVTSAATFYAFAVTEFVGLRQMGFLTGTGILLCMIAVLFLLPAMLAWSEDRHRRRETIPSLYLHGLGAPWLMRICFARPRATLAVGAAVTALCAVAAPGIEFRDSVREMRPAGNRGVLVQEEIGERFGSGFNAMMLVLRGDSTADVLRLAHRAAEGAREQVARGQLASFDTVSSLIPPPGRQEEALAWLARARADGRLDPDRVRSVFTAALATEGLRPEAFAHGLDLFSRAVTPPGPITVEDFQGTPQGRRVLDRYLHETAEGWRGVVYLYPPPGWKREAPPGSLALAEELGRDAVLTGTNVMSSFLRGQVRRDAAQAAALGFALVALLLWLDYRSVGATLLTLVPLLIGVLWMLGAMAFLGLTMNFMNVFVTTMILGIGVDYGIHVLHRHRELAGADAAEREKSLMETGKAIALAALSTVVGFGSMSLSHYPGLRSMGLVAILGAVCTCLVAITLLPAYLALRDR